MVDLLTTAHTCEAQTTAVNPAYEMMKQRGEKEGAGEEQEYEVMGVCLVTNLPTARSRNETYISSHPSCQPFPSIPLSVDPPTGGDVCVVREEKEENVYDTIPGDK